MVTKSTPLASDAAERWLKHRKAFQAEATYRSDKSALKHFIDYLPSKQVGRITADDVTGFLEACSLGEKPAATRPCNPDTVWQRRNKLVAFFEYCHARGWSSLDIKTAVTLPKSGHVRKDYIRLTPVEMIRLLDLCEHPRDRMYLALQMNTGLRASSITLLKIKHVHLDKGYLFVQVPKSSIVDKLVITADLEPELRQYLTWYRESYGDLQPDWFLVPAKRQRQFVSYNVKEPAESVRMNPEKQFKQVTRSLRPILKRLGYSDEELAKEGSHTLRRSAAVAFRDLLIARGVDDPHTVVSAFLHHKNDETTRIYLGWTREKMIRDEALSGKGFLSALTEKPDNVVDINERRKA
jgi:integrase